MAEIEQEHILASAAEARKSEVPLGFKSLKFASRVIASLAAAYLLTKDDTYAEEAANRTLLLLYPGNDPLLPTQLVSRENIIDWVPFAEIARASSFLADSPAFTAHSEKFLRLLSTALQVLSHDPNAQLARDTKDHRASAWLLIASALARATRDEAQLDQLRLRFKRPTLRNQIAADGRFPQEVATENPYRNSLFNFDLLAGACQLLTSPYDDLWSFELPDGPGMRSVAAYLYPVIRDRAKWGFPADATHYRDLPGRRPALLFAGRAYDRPEYVELFRSQSIAPPPADIAYSFPITQPLLWTSRAPHGL